VTKLEIFIRGDYRSWAANKGKKKIRGVSSLHFFLRVSLCSAPVTTYFFAVPINSITFFEKRDKDVLALT